MSGRMIWNERTQIYEMEQDPRQYMTGSMQYNHKVQIWEPRQDDPHNMYGNNYMPNASKTMQYDNSSMTWQPKPAAAPTTSAKKNVKSVTKK